MKRMIFGTIIIFSLFIGIGSSDISDNKTENAGFTPNNDTGSISSNLTATEVGILGAIFPDNEAGISAYTKATSAIDLDYAKNAFRTVETQTSTYIIGSVPIPGLPETEDAHVYVNKNGWILAYYMRDIPVSKMVQWSGYTGGEVTSTTLADAISNVASNAGVSYPAVKYYDFKYPGANRLMMIIDWLPGDGGDSYQFKIPGNFTLNENSWSYRTGGCTYYGCNRWKHIDGADFPGDFGAYGVDYDVHFGFYSAILSPNVYHTVDVGTYRYGDTGINTVLVYRQP